MKPRNDLEREFQRLVNTKRVRKGLSHREAMTAWKYCNSEDNKLHNSIYFATYQVVGEWLLQKVFIVTSYKKRKANKREEIIWVNGINAQGKRVSVGVGKFMYSYAYNRDLTIKNLTFDCWHDSAYAFSADCNHLPAWTKPMQADLITWEQSDITNTFDGLWHFCNHSWMQTLVNQNRIELLKLLLERVAPNFYNYYHKNLLFSVNKELWSAIKQTRKQGKEYDWANYLDYIDMCQQLGYDICNPFYSCPEDLTHAHAHVNAIIERRREEQRSKQEKEQLMKEQETFDKIHENLKGILIVGSDMMLHSLDTPKEYVDEGEAMHHCVARYVTHNSLILSARDNQGNRLATIEVSLNDYKIVQIRAVCNEKPQKYNEIKALVEDNLASIKSRNNKLKIA